MAVFTDTLYTANSGLIHKIRLSPESAAAAGTPPAGPATSDIIVKVSKANAEFGIRPRNVRLSRTVGTGATAFREYKTLPVLTPTDFASPTFAIGATITIGGVTWTIIVRNEEDF